SGWPSVTDSDVKSTPLLFVVMGISRRRLCWPVVLHQLRRRRREFRQPDRKRVRPREGPARTPPPVTNNQCRRPGEPGRRLLPAELRHQGGGIELEARAHGAAHGAGLQVGAFY